MCLLSSWLRQDVHSEEEELHSSDEEDNSSTSSKEHLDEADRQVITHEVIIQQTVDNEDFSLCSQTGLSLIPACKADRKSADKSHITAGDKHVTAAAADWAHVSCQACLSPVSFQKWVCVGAGGGHRMVQE